MKNKELKRKLLKENPEFRKEWRKMLARNRKLKKEFQEWVELGLWQGEDKYTKNFAVGNVADWWIDKIDELT